MVKLWPDQQAELIKEAPRAFKSAQGAWGLRGATYVHLRGAEKPVVRRALIAAWRNTAPKKLVGKFQQSASV
jgi:hypothetical protein